MKKLILLVFILSSLGFAQKSVLTQAQKDSIRAMISDSLDNFRLQVDTILTGTATLTAGLDSVVVTHGLGFVPSLSNIDYKAIDWMKGNDLTIENITSTTFELQLDTTWNFEDLTENVRINWYIFNADVSSLVTNASIKEVGTDRPYTTIQDAITAASTGDIIKVYNGTYSADLVIDKTLKVIGDNATITGTVNVFADNVILKDLTINKSTDSALVIDGADNVLIENVNITGTATKLRFLNSTNVKYIGGIVKTLKVSYENSDVIFKPTKQYIYNGGNYIMATGSDVEYSTTLRMLSTVTGNDTITRQGATLSNGSNLTITNSDMVLGVGLSDSSNADISNSIFTRYPYFSTSISASGLLKISNTYVEMNYPDTVSGLHIFEMASNTFPTTTAKIKCYNSYFVFGNDRSIRMGGALGALTADTMAEFSAYHSTFISYVDDVTTLAYAPTFAMNRPTIKFYNCVVRCIDEFNTNPTTLANSTAFFYNENLDHQIKAEIVNTYLEAPLRILRINETLTTNQVKSTDSIIFINNTVNCLSGEDSSWFDAEITADYLGRDSVIKYNGFVPTADNSTSEAVIEDTIKTKILMIGANQDHEIIPVYPSTYSTYIYGGTLFPTAIQGDTIYIKFTWEQAIMYKQAYAECLLGSAQNDDSTRTQMWKLNIYQGGSGKGTYGKAVVDTAIIFDTPDGYYELSNIKYYDSGDTYLTVMAVLDTFSQAQARKQVISLFIKSQYFLDNVTISLTP